MLNMILQKVIIITSIIDTIASTDTREDVLQYSTLQLYVQSLKYGT